MAATCSVVNQLEVLGFIPLNLEQQKLKAGENYSIGFRPEAVELVDDFGSDKESLYLPVKVLSTEFLGAKRRLFCTIHIDGIEQAKHLLQIEIENTKFKSLQELMFIKVPNQLIHVFDEQGYALC